MVSSAGLEDLPTVVPKAGRDDRITLLFALLIGLYLIISLALPLGFMMWKSTEVRTFAYGAYEVEVNQGAGWGRYIERAQIYSNDWFALKGREVGAGA